MKRCFALNGPENSRFCLAYAPYFQCHGQDRNTLYRLNQYRCQHRQHGTEPGYDIPSAYCRGADSVAQLVGRFGIPVGVKKQRNIAGGDRDYQCHPVRHKG